MASNSKDKPQPGRVTIKPVDEPAPELTAHGVFYPGATPGMTEFSGALFDSQGQVLSRAFHAALPFVLDSSKRGRPPKDDRAALCLLAAFDVALCKQQIAGYGGKKALARESLGYADDRSARLAIANAQKQVDRLLPTARWQVVFLAQGPFDIGSPPPANEDEGLQWVWIVGDGERPRIGEAWHGRAIAVMAPEGFKPRKQKAAVQWVDRLKFEGG